jgi:hypothetical protein
MYHSSQVGSTELSMPSSKYRRLNKCSINEERREEKMKEQEGRKILLKRSMIPVSS